MSPIAVVRVCAKTARIRIGGVRVPVGPFRAPTDSRRHYPSHASDTMPSWWSDSESHKWVVDDRVFGFHNPDGLRYFTTSDRKKLRRGEFGIREFMCPPGTFFHGREQVVFDPSKAIQTARFRPLPLRNM